MLNRTLKRKIVEGLENILCWDYADSESGDAFTQRISVHIGKTIGVAPRWGSPDVNEIIPIGIIMFEQPYGTQMSPDIAIMELDTRLKIKKKTGWIPNTAVTIEVKRSAVGKVMWNSGYPTQDRIYILNTKSKFNNENINGTTMVLGSDLVSKEQEQNAIEIKKSLKGYKRNIPDIGSFILSHLRPMFSQSPSDGNWLSYKDREEREENVLKFIENR